MLFISILFTVQMRLIDVELIVDQVVLLGGHDQAAFLDFACDIDSRGSEVGSHACDHGAGVEVEAAVVLV